MIRSVINSTLLCLVITFFLLLFHTVECRHKHRRFDPVSYFSFYKCKGSFDSVKIMSLAFRCIQCYDGNYGAYNYRSYCSRDCFQTYTYKECLQKLQLPEAAMEVIRKDVEFITTKMDFASNDNSLGNENNPGQNNTISDQGIGCPSRRQGLTSPAVNQALTMCITTIANGKGKKVNLPNNSTNKTGENSKHSLVDEDKKENNSAIKLPQSTTRKSTRKKVKPVSPLFKSLIGGG